VIVGSHICDELKASGIDVPLRLTFAGNPLACLLALSVQEHIIKNRIGEHVTQNTSFIKNNLSQACPAKTHIHGVGHLWGVEMNVERGSGETALQRVKAAASLRSLEFMGGFRSGEHSDSVHVLLTPPFDAEKSELIASIDSAASLIGLAGDN
jgi:adenosylmethionine-8-amino-7-oxononanoate aminotransferase